MLIRESPGERNPENARFEPGATSETAIRVSAAPVAEDDAKARESLPTGMRDKEALRFWIIDSGVEVMLSGPNQRRGDRLRYPAEGGPVYQIVAASKWHSITACLAVRL